VAPVSLPAATGREDLAPPPAPTCKGLWIKIELLDQLLPTLCTEAVFHSHHQNDYGAQIDLAPKKTHRWRGGATPASIGGTTKTQATITGLIQCTTDATRLAWVTGTVQHTTTSTTTGLNFGSDILIDSEQKLIKPGIIEKCVTHWTCLPFFLVEKQETAPSDNFQVI
jgi:hypothetical protein